jgi:hypothetical protein
MSQPVNINYKLANRFVLAHYGVLGMHWGHHLPGRNEASHNPKPRKVKADPHPDHVETSSLRKKPTSSLSTAQLKKINDRLQTERKNKELDPKGLSKGKKIALGIIAAAGTGATVYNLANSPAGTAAKKAGKSAALRIISKYVRSGTGRHVLSTTVKAAARHI